MNGPVRRPPVEDIESTRDVRDETRVTVLEQQIAALVSALERVRDNFIHAVRGEPVRDMAETLAEVDAALAAGVVDNPTGPTCPVCVYIPHHPVDAATFAWHEQGHPTEGSPS